MCGKVTTMVSKLVKSLLATAMVALTPWVAFAHTGVGDTSGFVHGFGHPISGLDRILAMVMVGVFAWQLGGRGVATGPAETRRVCRYRANRRQYLCRAWFQYRSA